MTRGRRRPRAARRGGDRLRERVLAPGHRRAGVDRAGRGGDRGDGHARRAAARPAAGGAEPGPGLPRRPRSGGGVWREAVDDGAPHRRPARPGGHAVPRRVDARRTQRVGRAARSTRRANCSPSSARRPAQRAQRLPAEHAAGGVRAERCGATSRPSGGRGARRASRSTCTCPPTSARRWPSATGASTTPTPSPSAAFELSRHFDEDASAHPRHPDVHAAARARPARRRRAGRPAHRGPARARRRRLGAGARRCCWPSSGCSTRRRASCGGLSADGLDGLGGAARAVAGRPRLPRGDVRARRRAEARRGRSTPSCAGWRAATSSSARRSRATARPTATSACSRRRSATWTRPSAISTPRWAERRDWAHRPGWRTPQHAFARALAPARRGGRPRARRHCSRGAPDGAPGRHRRVLPRG